MAYSNWREIKSSSSDEEDKPGISRPSDEDDGPWIFYPSKHVDILNHEGTWEWRKYVEKIRDSPDSVVAKQLKDCGSTNYEPLIAAKNGFIKLIEKLLEIGFNVDERMAGNKETMLHAAAQNDHRELVEYLISKGAQLEIGDWRGDTPLHWAAWNGHDWTVQYLVRCGANIDATNIYGFAPLHYASWDGHALVVKFLRHKNCNKEIKNFKGETALDLAVMLKHDDIVKLLSP